MYGIPPLILDININPTDSRQFANELSFFDGYLRNFYGRNDLSVEDLQQSLFVLQSFRKLALFAELKPGIEKHIDRLQSKFNRHQLSSIFYLYCYLVMMSRQKSPAGSTLLQSLCRNIERQDTFTGA